MAYLITEQTERRPDRQDWLIERVMKILAKWPGQRDTRAISGDEFALGGEEAEDFTI